MFGIVTWFNIPKGYGEIYAETGEVFFFTYHALPKSTAFRVIERGQFVEFQPSNDEYFGERKASKVSVVKKIPAKHLPKIDQLKGVVR